MEVLRIKETDVFLDDQGEGRGKITISNSYGYNYSSYWGAMGGSLKDFILRINDDYFSRNLLGANSLLTFDSKLTRRNVRKYIREEIMPWYKHTVFQKELRRDINFYFGGCDTSNDFVNNWHRFIDRLPFYLIEDRWERERIEEEFRGVSEPWSFIGERMSDEYVWLCGIHNELKKRLRDVA